MKRKKRVIIYSFLKVFWYVILVISPGILGINPVEGCLIEPGANKSVSKWALRKIRSLNSAELCFQAWNWCFLQLALGFQLFKPSLKCELEHCRIAVGKLSCNFIAAILCFWVYCSNAVVCSVYLSIQQGTEIFFGQIPLLCDEVDFDQHTGTTVYSLIVDRKKRRLQF